MENMWMPPRQQQTSPMGSGIGARGGGGFGQLMQDPMFKKMVMSQLAKKKKKRIGIEGLLNGGGSFADLGKQLPKLKETQERWKMQDADRKAKKLKIDYLTKQAEQAANQQQIEAARNSV